MYASWTYSPERAKLLFTDTDSCYDNVMLSTKPEVLTVYCSQRRQRRTESRPQITCRKIWWRSWSCGFRVMRVERQTDILIAVLLAHPGGEVIRPVLCIIIMSVTCCLPSLWPLLACWRYWRPSEDGIVGVGVCVCVCAGERRGPRLWVTFRRTSAACCPRHLLRTLCRPTRSTSLRHYAKLYRTPDTGTTTELLRRQPASQPASATIVIVIGICL